MSNQRDTLKNVLGNIEKRFGKEAISKKVEGIKRLSSGSKRIDGILGGGYPIGRLIEIYGWESSGKTTMALIACREAQKKGKIVSYIDTEHSLDLEYAEQLGVNVSPSKFILSQPDCGEDAIEIARELVKAKEIGLIVMDSIAAMTPRSVIDGEAGDHKMAALARMMSQMTKPLINPLKGSDCCIILTNQLRENIGMFGGSYNPGGNAVKFYSSLRIEVVRMQQVKNKEGEVIGQDTKIKTKKNKVFPPHKETTVFLRYGTGFDILMELLEIAIELGIIKKSGSWFSYNETKIGQGQENVLSLLKDNPELVEEIELKVNQNA
jgi:recombination protein RecA